MRQRVPEKRIPVASYGESQVHVRKFIGQHDDRRPDLDFRMPDCFSRRRDAHDLRGSERLLIKLKRASGALDDEIRRRTLHTLLESRSRCLT